VDKPADGIRSNKTQKPKDKQNNCNCCKHRRLDGHHLIFLHTGYIKIKTPGGLGPPGFGCAKFLSVYMVEENFTKHVDEQGEIDCD